ncbi:hypothetical protein A3H85_03380 [Candidatus Daviesbacteria bacterium RIFCSPLOWO2_02_FULL_40_8]|nr:MAG: hypothetical protein A3H85_03380 [Candidatus Daviesbacteria bacterium RIFCSPLOWO2_02_FULL_40_8]
MIFKLTLLLIIFITPLLTPNWGFSYENIKVLGFVILVSVIVLEYALNKKRPQLRWSRVSAISLLFLLSLSLSSILGVKPPSSIMGEAPYYQGLIFYIYLFVFSLLVGISGISIRQWVVVLSLSSLLVSVFSIKDYLLLHLFQIYTPTYADRVVSTFGQPNFYAGFILLTLPLTSYLFKSPRNFIRLLGYLSLILGSLAIIASESRVTSGLLLIFLLTWLIIRAPKIVGLTLAFFLGFISATYFWINLSTQGWDQTWLIRNAPERRLLFMPTLLEVSKKSLLVGYGLENIGVAYQRHFQEMNFNTLNDPLAHALKNLQVDRSHSYLLDILLFSGILGLVSYLGLVVILIFKTKSQLPLLSSLMIYLIWTQLHNQSVVHLIYFWWLVGVVSQEAT